VYELEEFDGSQLRGTFSGNRLKKFVLRSETTKPVVVQDTDLDFAHIDPEPSPIPSETGPRLRRTVRFEIRPPELTAEQKAEYRVFS
jgi:hypothetical protein